VLTTNVQEKASYIMKISGTCNLGCPYCYYFKNKSRTEQASMKLDVLNKFLDEASKRSQKIELIWHGGEPLATDISVYRDIVKKQKEISQEAGVTFRNVLQTNGTLINQEWINFFIEEKFGIGVSLDGTQEIHDIYRLSLSKNGTFEKTIRGINLLKKNGVPVSVLAVVTKNSLSHAKEIYEFFVNELGLFRFDFLPMVEIITHSQNKDQHRVDSGTKNFIPGSLEQGDFAAFMNEIFDLWWASNSPNVSVRFLDNVLLGLLGKRPKSCTFNGSCGNYTTLDVDGTLSPCDNFVEYKDLAFGNIKTDSLNDMLDSSKRQSYRKLVGSVHSSCTNCKFLHACGGGCRKYNFFLNQNFSDPNYFCGDRWTIFNHVDEIISRTFPTIKEIFSSLDVNQNNLVHLKSSSISGSQTIYRLGRHYLYTMNNIINQYEWEDWDRESGGGDDD
jgi:uncharacterized protein